MERMMTVNAKDLKFIQRAAEVTEKLYPRSQCFVNVREMSMFVDCVVNVGPNMDVSVPYAFLQGYYLGFSEGRDSSDKNL